VTTTYKILYWQEVPSQIKAEDERDEVTLTLGARFMERIDLLAAKRGLQGADDYLAQWQWGEEQQRAGAAQDVAEAVQAELEAEANW
jgi:cvfA/B/C family virulence factor